MEKVDQNNAHLKIKDGNLLIAPTSAGWSILSHARNHEALTILRKLKNRGADTGFTILVESDARLNRLVNDVPAIAWDILDTSDGGIILVLPEGRNVDPEALAGDGSIALRMVTDPPEIKLVRLVNGPVASTALLDSEGLPVESPEEADPAILEEIDYLLNLPTLSKLKDKQQIPIVKLSMSGEVKIIRD